MPVTLRDYAVEYAGFGWPIVPFHSVTSEGACTCDLGSACDDAGKHPRLNPIDDQPGISTSSAQVFDWWTAAPQQNIGVVCGREKSGFVVLDVAALRGGLAALEDLEATHGRLPDGPRVATGGGGRHLFFEAPLDPIDSYQDVAPGIDFVGEGGFVIVPPAAHASGRNYEWDEEPSRETVCPPMPGWLLDLLVDVTALRAKMDSLYLDAGDQAPAFSIAPADWNGELPEIVQGALEDDPRLHKIFRRDKRLGIVDNAGKADFALVCGLFKAGIREPRALAFAIMASRKEDPEADAAVARLGDGYWAKTVEAGMRQVEKEWASLEVLKGSTHAALLDGNGKDYAWNELGNADRFEAIHGADLLYHQTAKKWLVWDGRHYSDGLAVGRDQRGGQAGVELRAQTFLRDLAAKLPQSCLDDDARIAAEKFARRSGTSGMQNAILALCRGRCEVTEEELDVDPFSLCVPNGVVDLRTGTTSRHDRHHKATKIASAIYYEEAESDLWDDFLKQCLPDQDVRLYFQKCIGYSLLGVQPEQVFFFVHGPGSTGKSTAFKAIQGALGTYHKAADFSTFLAQGFGGGGGGGPSPDLARLARVRIVFSTEVGGGQALNDGLIKQISGGDTMTTRGLHAEHQEWTPILSLWLVANDRPKGRVDDDALWRRLRPFEFANKIDPGDVDSTLGARLAEPENKAAILAWAIRGAGNYLESGELRPPAAVLEGVQQYRSSSNPIAEFYADACVMTPGSATSRPLMWKAYQAWCRENEARPMRKRAFFAVLESDHPFFETNVAWMVDGIGLQNPGFEAGADRGEVM